MRLFLALCLLLAAGGCAGNGARPGAAVALPPLRLAPSSLPASLALQQALQFRLGSHQREMVALLESDADAVRLAVQAMGQMASDAAKSMRPEAAAEPVAVDPAQEAISGAAMWPWQMMQQMREQMQQSVEGRQQAHQEAA